MPSTFKTFAEQIKDGTAEHNLIRQQQDEAKAIKLRQQERRTKPLTEQITELMRTLPPSIRNRPWSMADLVSRLQGKFHDRPHGQHVGAALKILGWMPERRYKGGYHGTRVWMPPLSK